MAKKKNEYTRSRDGDYRMRFNFPIKHGSCGSAVEAYQCSECNRDCILILQCLTTGGGLNLPSSCPDAAVGRDFQPKFIRVKPAKGGQ